MSYKQDPKARLLLRLMHEMSQEYWCAQWLIGCEYALWADLTGEAVNGEMPWGLTSEEKEDLRLLHEMAGGWFVWSEESCDIAFMTTDEWLGHLAHAGAAIR